MNFTIKGGDTFPIAEIKLNRGETVQLESGAMIYHNPAIELSGKLNSNGKKGLSGLAAAIGRSISGGESIFISTATSSEDNGIIAVAPGNPGPIKELQIDSNHQWRLNTGAFLASDSTASYKMVSQSISHALFGGTGGFFIMESQGEGSLLVSAYGDLIPLDLDGASDFIIDNNHVVAWETSLDYQIQAGSGVIGFKTGEGLVNRFSGTGRVYVQTRNIAALAELLDTYISSDSDNSN